jgi:hypothetical protein
MKLEASNFIAFRLLKTDNKSLVHHSVKRTPMSEPQVKSRRVAANSKELVFKFKNKITNLLV